LFVGRGTPEKRPELFLFIARRLPGLRFTMVGDMPEHILASLPPNVEFTGNISDEEALHRIYCGHHVLVIPSSTEGFPIVLMEAMARGCAVMATPVGDIPYHLDKAKGLLFSSTEAKVVEDEAVTWLQSLEPQALQEMSDHCRVYAKENFGIGQFNQQYKAILQP
jgi:glycosyltransferase involved in cell wall biosynthesis